MDGTTETLSEDGQTCNRCGEYTEHTDKNHIIYKFYIKVVMLWQQQNIRKIPMRN